MATLTPLLNSEVTLIYVLDKNDEMVGHISKYSPDFVPWSLAEEIETIKGFFLSGQSLVGDDLEGVRIFSEDQLKVRTLEHSF